MIESDGEIGISVMAFGRKAEIVDVFRISDESSDTFHNVASVYVERLTHHRGFMVRECGTA